MLKLAVFTGLGLWELSHLSVLLYTRVDLSHVALFCLSYWWWWSRLPLATPWTVACQAPMSIAFSRQEYWSGLPFPSPVQFRSVVQSCLTLCDPMDPLNHARLPCPSPTPRVYQTHVHWVSDIIQPYHPLSPPSPLILNLSQHQDLFKWVSSSYHMAKVLASTSVLPMNTQDWSPLGWTGWISLQSKGLSRVFSNTTVQKHQFFGPQLSF